MSQNKKILVFEHPYDLTNFLIKRWVELYIDTIKEGRVFTAALSGGRSPVEFYCKLAGLKDFDMWKKCHLFMTDERFVPHDDEDSSIGMLRRNLFDYVDVPLENIHPIKTDCEDASLSADILQSDIKDFFKLKDNEFPVFDFMLLGMGKDGHIASLFPKDKNILEMHKIALSYSEEEIKHQRISLTLPVINKAKNIFVIVTGSDKSNIIKVVFEEELVCPASMLNPVNGQLIYLTDKESVSKLSDETEYLHEGDMISIKTFNMRSVN